MKIFIRLSLFILSAVLTPSCVDPRWGPPRSGLRQNMAWQYPTIAPAEFTASPSPLPTPVPEIAPPPMTGSVQLIGKHAVSPPNAPTAVQRAVEAGNMLQNKGYRFGGGHAVLNDTAFDCSGTVSYVLRNAGLMDGQMPSRGFLNYGKAGEGNWITIWAKDGHVFMTIGGLRLDTGGNGGGEGPRWKTEIRKKDGFVPRHPPGL